MNNKFRITRLEQPYDRTDSTAYETLWTGIELPDEDTITTVKQSVREVIERQGHDPFMQTHTDAIVLQQQRRPAILGWKTLESMNIYRQEIDPES